MSDDEPAPPIEQLKSIMKSWQLRLLVLALFEALKTRYGSVRIVIADGKVSKIISESSYDASKPIDNL